jgi:D-alanyl-D-alanine carboxypeptidase
MKGTVPATSGVLPGKAITRQDGADRAQRSWRILWGVALVALLALLPGAGQARAATPPAFSPAIQRQLQQALDHAVANPAVPGAIVGIWVPGRGTWIRAAGLADRATKRPMQVHDYMRIGSVTKTFIGTLILQLVGEGKLGLDDPIQPWAPQVPNAEHITVRELLNMSSGLYSYTEDRQWVQQAVSPQTGQALRPWTPQQLVRVAVAHKPYFPPGKGWHYSNTNFILLGLIIEQVTGRPVEDVLRTRILRPLGLQHTVFPTASGMPAPYAVGYFPAGPHRLVRVATMNPSWAWTAGAMISTLDDLHTWARALATGALLRPAQQRQRLIWNPYSAAATHGLARYGLGIADLVGFIGHNGGLPGFNTDMYYLPATHATVVVIANSFSEAGRASVSPADDLFQQIVKIAFPAQYPH